MANDNQGGDKNRFIANIKLGTMQVSPADVMGLSITSEVDHPDSFSVHLGATDAVKDIIGKLKVGNPIEVSTIHEADPNADKAFVGEVIGIEPLFASSGDTRSHVIVRGINALHSLSRGKRSNAYSRLPDGLITDKDILTSIVGRYAGIESIDYGDGGAPDIQYKHVYQHNQTDLEFIRLRAARIGYYVLVRDKKLLFRKRTAKWSGLKLVLNIERTPAGAVALNRFVPTVSTANQFSEVRVRAFKPAERVETVRTYPKSSDKPLFGNGNSGVAASEEAHKDAPVVRVDIPFDSDSEGDALAKSIAMERMLNYITVEGSAPGDPRLKAGLVVTVETGASEKDAQGQARPSQYDGKYFITYVRHWYRQKGGEPYTTDFRAQRDATDADQNGAST